MLQLSKKRIESKYILLKIEAQNKIILKRNSLRTDNQNKIKFRDYLHFKKIIVLLRSLYWEWNV
jgi:hypothetical protein